MKPTTYYPWLADDGVIEDIDENGYVGTAPNKAAPDNSVYGYKLEAL